MRFFILFLAFIFIESSVFSQKSEDFEITHSQADDGRIIFYAKNNTLMPYQIRLDFKEMENLKASHELPYITVVYPDQDFQPVIELRPIKAHKGTSFSFDYGYLQGDYTVEIDVDYPYILPYPHQKKYKLTQGYNGKSTHKNMNALDFNLDIGDTISAARAGLVVEVIDHNNKSGRDPKLEPFANKIVILHSDGTTGHYVHLVQNGSLVRKGDFVEKGQVIGLSGNTGYSFGAHLHFMVVKYNKMSQETLQTKFYQGDGQVISLEEGKNYYSVHPDKKPFEIIRAEDIDIEKLKFFRGVSEENNNLKIVTDKIDDVVFVYADNGFNRKVSGKLKVDLKNMKSSEKLPYEFEAPSNSKIFLFKLEPINNLEAHSYQLSVEFRK